MADSPKHRPLMNLEGPNTVDTDGLRKVLDHYDAVLRDMQKQAQDLNDEIVALNSRAAAAEARLEAGGL